VDEALGVEGAGCTGDGGDDGHGLMIRSQLPLFIPITLKALTY
jgi:hypothetical protein